MKVILEAQYAWSPNPRGLHHYAIQLIRKLLERATYDYELTFFDYNRECGNYARIKQHFGEYNVPMHECNTLDYRAARSERDVFKEKSYNDYTGACGDVFHFTHLITIPDNLKGKMVVTVHDMTVAKYPQLCPPQLVEWFALGVKRLEDMQPAVIAISKSTKNDVLKYTAIPEEKIQVVHNGFTGNYFDERISPAILKQMGINFPYLLYVGGIGGQKNVERIVKAFELAADKIPDVKLIIAGKAEPVIGEAEVSRIKQNPYFGSRIIAPGYVTEEQKYALYAGAVCFVFPSLYEGFGLPVLEAMDCGCPVITSDVSSLPEVAGNAAVLVDPYNIEQLAYEMERVVNSESLRNELRQKGFEQCKKFSWDKTAAATEEVYRAAVNS